MFYKVIFTYQEGDSEEILLESGDINKAKAYAKYKALQLRLLPAIKVKKISQYEAEWMAEGSCINWSSL